MKRYLLCILLIVSGALPAVAQDDAPMACTLTELEEVNEVVERGMGDLAFIVSDDYTTIGEAIDDVTVLQRRYWDDVGFAPYCLEAFTRGYEAGRIIDHYAIAYGLMAAAEADSGNVGQANRLRDQADKHIRRAEEVARLRLPDIYEEFFTDGLEPIWP